MSNNKKNNFKVLPKTKSTKNKPKLTIIQKIMISTIVILLIAATVMVVFTLTHRPEDEIKNLISKLSSNYYENYLYANFSQTASFKENPDTIMQKYEKYGFSSITLGQLLLYDNKKNQEHTDFLKSHCDINKTTIKFYPESPYQKNNYHVDYTYSCDF